jgi:nuclear pore complex protein Nup133
VPISGKVIYWDTVDNVNTLELMRNQKLSVEFTIPNMGSDLVTEILNLDAPMGFIVGFRSGKMAFMNFTPEKSNTRFDFQYLTSGSKKGGIFGSIRGFLPGQYQQEEIAALGVAPPISDQLSSRDIIMITKRGKIQSWNIQRGGFGSLLAQVEGREAIVTAMKQTQPSLLNSLLLESFEVIDFSYFPKPPTKDAADITDLQSISTKPKTDAGMNLILLASLVGRERAYYSLVEVIVRHDELVVGNVRPLRKYTTPISRLATFRPRLYLPHPAVAFAVFDQAILVISMSNQPESPESQLRAENLMLPKPFEEELIPLGKDMNIEVVGSGVEESREDHGRTKQPAAVLLVRGKGVIRVATTDIDKLAAGQIQQITPKSQLEQAVFYGTLKGNPLDFQVRPEMQFPAEEVGAAALELSLDILTSRTPHIPSVNASIDKNLKTRADSLRHLAEHLQATGLLLDRTTRWQLLWNAEKMEAACLIWKSYDSSVRTNRKGQRRGLMADIVDYINESHKTNAVAEVGETDRIRHWFIHDLSAMDIALPWAYEVMKYSYQDGQHDHDFIMHSLSEANDVLISALEGAFNFRTANLNLYGLHEELLEHGVLTRGYDGLPEFWTSTTEIVKNINKQATLAAALLGQYCNPEHVNSKALADPAVAEKIRDEHPRVLDLVIRSSAERIHWASAQSSPQLQLEAEELDATQIVRNDQHIVSLAELGLIREAIELAEKHQILPTLAAIIMLQIRLHGSAARQLRLSEQEYKDATPEVAILEDRVRYYFKKFGTSWATAFYEHNIEVKAMSNLLEAYQDQRSFLTAFLRSKPEYTKLSWLHDVLREQDYDHAAQSLLDLGLKRERDLWSKKIELSMGKLARLASDRNYSQAEGLIIPDGGDAELVETRNQLGLVKIQDQAYKHVLPTIEAAIDDKAEVPLALESHGNKSLKNKKGFSQLLEESMTSLIKHEVMDALALIDLLTLMDGDGNTEEQWEFQNQQFYLALQALKYALLEKDEEYLVQRIIWRRCMLRDDWTVVNDTENKPDEEVKDSLRNTILYWTFKSCEKHRKSHLQRLLLLLPLLIWDRRVRLQIFHCAGQATGYSGRWYGSAGPPL